MKGLYKIYQDAPPIGKIIILLMVCVLAYILYKVVKKITTPGPENEDILTSSQSEIKTLSNQGENPHYSNSQYETWADSLYQSMDGWATDEDKIFNIMHYMQNKADVLKLISAFGIRKRVYNSLFAVGDDLNLNQWLTEELSVDDIKKINDDFKNKQINFSF